MCIACAYTLLMIETKTATPAETAKKFGRHCYICGEPMKNFGRRFATNLGYHTKCANKKKEPK